MAAWTKIVSAAVIQKIRTESGVAARPATSNIRAVDMITAEISPTREPNSRRPAAQTHSTVPIPSNADGRRAANSDTPNNW